MSNIKKTNVMRILDQHKINYQIYSYDKRDGKIDGLSVAEKIGKSVDLVYKTLLAEGNSKELYVFLISVTDELDLKKAAKVTGEKKIHMIHVKDILKMTGYIRGGCSPIGMKKQYLTFIDQKAEFVDKLIISAGQIGLQVEIETSDLLKMTQSNLYDLTNP